MDLSCFFEKPHSIHFNGYCAEFEDFIKEAYKHATTCGCIVTDKLQNPTVGNVEYFQDKLGSEFACTLPFFETKFKVWLPQLNTAQSSLLAKSAYTVFEQLRSSGKNIHALKNFYTKLMCWLYYKFVNVLTKIDKGVVPVVIYVGDYGLYELRTMQILNLCGCSTAYIDLRCDETTYKEYDNDYKLSSLYKFDDVNSFPPSWSVKNIGNSIFREQKFNKALGDRSKISEVVRAESVDFDSIEPSSHCMLLVLGIDSEWQNVLFKYKSELHNAEFIIKSVPPVRPDEIKSSSTQFNTVDDCLLSLLNSCKEGVAFKVAFYETINKFAISNIQKCIGLYYLCLRYKKLFSDGYFFVLTDSLSETTKFVIYFLTYFNVNIIVLNPSKSDISLDNFHVKELSDKSDITEYPTSQSVVSTTTVASRAETEIMGVLYNGDLGIYKEHQYSSAEVTHLNCTYEEIAILWNEELRFREGFKTEDNVVTMPTIYAKINGVSDGDYKKFVQLLMMFKETSLVYEDTIWSGDSDSVYSAKCMLDGKVSFDKIRELPLYKYSYLREPVQRFMISKIQELLQIGVIKGIGKHGVENVLFSVILNIPEHILRALQDFDFTKKNPKLLNIRTSTTQMSLEDTILVNYLSLLGFDILFIVPTGYNVLNTHITKELYKTFECGNYKYDFKMDDLTQKSFFSKLFGR